MDTRTLKDLLYEQVARIGKAIASPKRLELLELLAQGEKSVEALANEASIDIKLVSAHLKALRQANLVQSRRTGRFILYRLSATDVADLWVSLREVAQEHLLELSTAVSQFVAKPNALCQLSRRELLSKAKSGEVIMIDVRPTSEYNVAHLPHARSMPLTEIRQRLNELPLNTEIVAYCRGPFCFFSDEALSLLRQHGFTASKLTDGVSEWSAAGLPLSKKPATLEETP